MAGFTACVELLFMYSTTGCTSLRIETFAVHVKFFSGTPAGTTTSLFLEPALLPASEDESKFSEDLSDDEEPNGAPGPLVQPLYIAMEDCQLLSSSQLEGIKRASCVTELLLGRPLECVSLVPSW